MVRIPTGTWDSFIPNGIWPTTSGSGSAPCRMYAPGANAIASFTMVGVVGRIQVISRNRSGSSSHAGGCCPWSSQRCSTVAAGNASHRAPVL